MKNRIVALGVGMVLTLISFLAAQITFERWYGGTSSDIGRSVSQTSDGGYIIAGHTESFGSGGYDVYLVKTDSFGDTTWTRTYGGTDADHGHSVAQTIDGGYIVAGTTESYGAGNIDIYLIKTNPAGDTAWTRTFGGTDSEYGYSVAQTTDGGYIIAGQKDGDAYLIKTNGSGYSLWAHYYGSPESDGASSVALTQDGGYIVAGWTMPSGVGSSNLYLICTDSLGDSIWAKAYSDTVNSHGNAVIQTTDGGFAATGQILPFYPYYTPDMYLLKTDSEGDTIWTRTFGTGDTWEEGHSVAQTSDGGYIITGEIDVSVTNRDAWLIKTDTLGNPQWEKTFGGADPDRGNSVAQTTDAGYIIAGFTWSFGAGSQDVYIIKTDSLGNMGIEEAQNPGHTSTDIKLTTRPNPFSSSTTLTLYGAQGHKNTGAQELHIFDASGRLVESIKLVTSPCQLGTDLKAGVYFLKLKVGNYTETKKLIKIR
jgi:hypothetical protein